MNRVIRMPDGSSDPVLQFIDALYEGIHLLDSITSNGLENSMTKTNSLKFQEYPAASIFQNDANPKNFSKSSRISSPNCKSTIEVLSFLMVAVHKDYRRCGLGRKLIQKSLEIGKKLGCDFVKCEAVALSSQTLYEQMGFQTVKVVQHKEWLTTEGKQIFVCDDGTTCGKLMLSKL